MEEGSDDKFKNPLFPQYTREALSVLKRSDGNPPVMLIPRPRLLRRGSLMGFSPRRDQEKC